MNKHDLLPIRQRERERFDFVVHRDGLDAGLTFVLRTLRMYQTTLRYTDPDPSKPKHNFSRNREYFAEFVGSILELKAILREYNIPVRPNYVTVFLPNEDL